MCAALFPPRPWAGVHNPDHGEVWTLPWRVKQAGTPAHEPRGGATVRLAGHGVRFPYVLEREMAFLAPDRLALRYRAANPAAVEAPHPWSAHPVLAGAASPAI